MNLSAENIGKIRELVRSGYPLKARDAKDLLGHNDHLVELLEARGRLMLGVEIERDQLRAEVAGLKTGYEAYERVNAELKSEVEGLRQSVADHKQCIASDNELFRDVNLECNRYHSVIVAVGELLGISKEEQDEEEATQEELVEAINELWGQVHGMQEDLDTYKSEHEALRNALGDLLSLYDTDEGCRSLPQYIAGRAALGQGEQS